jgi:putative nucleotidyltransferase with HDIG domain
MPLPGSTLAQPALAPELLRLARERQIAGQLMEAVDGYAAAAAAAEREGDGSTLAQALRLQAVVVHSLGDSSRAHALCARSSSVARGLGDERLVSEALNTMGGLELETGALIAAADSFRLALGFAGDQWDLWARIEQNLGIVATVQGEAVMARWHYARSLRAYRRGGDRRGCALALHNLGMLNADQRRWAEAERCFGKARRLARLTRDHHLEALCFLNGAEVELAQGRMEAAEQSADAARCLFEELGTNLDLADVWKILGMASREARKLNLAEARLRTAIELAASTGNSPTHAEALLELARTHQALGRPGEVLAGLEKAYSLFAGLGAKNETQEIVGWLERLEQEYLEAVGECPSETALGRGGHGARVAACALAVARAMALDPVQAGAIRVGAYLHDRGMARIPRSLLEKTGALTLSEREQVRRHPQWGVEIVAALGCPWSISEIVRSHHERYDGSGYPDGLAGEAIPLAAQIVGIADVYDALTSERSYRRAVAPAEAVARIANDRQAWHPAVLDAFLRQAGGSEHPQVTVA